MSSTWVSIESCKYCEINARFAGGGNGPGNPRHTESARDSTWRESPPRRLGVVTEEMRARGELAKHGEGRPKKGDHTATFFPPTLADFGIPRRVSATATAAGDNSR